MSRPKTPVNAKRGERLKIICQETKTTQISLAEQTGISQQAISAMIQGKANVTDTTATCVIGLFPQYRYEWLMGIDDYKTRDDVYTQRLISIRSLDEIITGLSKACGYNFLDLTRAANLDKNLIDEVVITCGQQFVIEHGGKTVLISFDEWDALQKEIKDMVSIRLKYLFKQKEQEYPKEDA